MNINLKKLNSDFLMFFCSLRENISVFSTTSHTDGSSNWNKLGKAKVGPTI